MKKNKMKRIISLLLVAVMIFALVLSLASCNDTGDTTDEPVTAEAKLVNFISFKKPEVKELKELEDLTDELGSLRDSYDDYAIFLKCDKDKLNNLVETYTLYSLKDNKTVVTVSNSYSDEYDGLDDFGNERHPEKEIEYCGFAYADIPIFTVEYVKYAPIDEEIIEKEELEHSYSEEYYTEFYDVTGKLISTSYSASEVEELEYNDCYCLISLGKTVGLFDLNSYEMVESFDGDKAATPVLYHHINDKYNYLLDVPTAHTPEFESFGNARSAIEVYDKKGKLVCYYPYGDNHYFHQAFVLADGDILIQKMEYTESIDCDYFESYDGMEIKLNIFTYILDVETGKVTELADFKDSINYVYTKDEFNEEFADRGITVTDNTRNIILANDRDGKYQTVFMDNFGNVNFTFDGRLCYDMDDDYSFEDVRVLDGSHILVRLEAGNSSYAILGADGSVKTYLPEGATVLADCIVSGDMVYDFDMEEIRTYNNYWKDNYRDRYYVGGGYDNDYTDNVSYIRNIGNTEVYEYAYTVYDDINKEVFGIVIYDVKDDSVNSYDGYEVDDYISDYDSAEISDIIILANDEKNLYKIINGDGRCVLTVEADYYDYVTMDGGVIFSFETPDGYLTVLVKEYTMEGEYKG